MHRLSQLMHQTEANGCKFCIVVCVRLCHPCTLRRREPRKREHVKPSSHCPLQRCRIGSSDSSVICYLALDIGAIVSPKADKIRDRERWWQKICFKAGGLLYHTVPEATAVCDIFLQAFIFSDIFSLDFTIICKYGKVQWPPRLLDVTTRGVFWDAA